MTMQRTAMVLDPNFTGVRDSCIEAVGAGSHVVSMRGILSSVLVLNARILSTKFDFFAFGGENDIFGPHPSLQLPFPVSEYLPTFFPEMSQDAPPTLGAIQDAPRSLQISYESSTSHLPIVRPPRNTMRVRVPFPPLNPQC